MSESRIRLHHVVVTAELDSTTRNRNSRPGDGRVGIYPIAKQDECVIYPGQLVMSRRDGVTTGLMQVTSILNGEGADQMEAYKTNESAAIIALKSKFKFHGVSAGLIDPSGSMPIRAGTIVLTGVTPIDVNHPVSPGDILEAYFPDPRGPNPSANKSSGRSQWTLATRVYNRTTPVETLKTHACRLSRDPIRWKSVLGKKQADMWIESVKSCRDSYTTVALLFVNTLLEKGFIQFTAPEKTRLGIEDDTPHSIQVSKLAQAVGFVKPGDSGMDATASADNTRYTKLMDAFMQSVFYDGSNPNFEYGYETIKISDAPKARTKDGKVNYGTPEGSLLHMQVNHFTALVGAITNSIEDSRSWIIGKALTAAQPGSSCSVALGVGR